MTSKKYYDSRHACKQVNIQVGDKVRVKRNDFVRKGQSHFSQPMVVKKVFCNSALLSDGKTWHFSSLSLCRSGGIVPPSQVNSDNHGPPFSPDFDWLLDGDASRDSYPQRTDIASPDGVGVPGGVASREDSCSTSSSGELSEGAPHNPGTSGVNLEHKGHDNDDVSPSSGTVIKEPTVNRYGRVVKPPAKLHDFVCD